MDLWIYGFMDLLGLSANDVVSTSEAAKSLNIKEKV